jgi:hypothetical protein
VFGTEKTRTDEKLEPIMKLHAEILEKNGEKQFAILPYEEFLKVQERLADAEDLLELRKAKRAERKKRSIPLAEVKRQLGMKA